MNDLASLLLFQGLSFAYYALAQLSSRYAKIYVCLHQKIFTELGVAPLEVSRNRSSALPRRHYLIVIDGYFQKLQVQQRIAANRSLSYQLD